MGGKMLVTCKQPKKNCPTQNKNTTKLQIVRHLNLKSSV